MQKVIAEEALGVIRSEQACIKVVSTETDYDRCLQYVLGQLEDPMHYRPIKQLSEKNYHRHFVLNPLTGEKSYRPCEETTRGAVKQTDFTKKTSVSYLPADGVMHFYKPKNGNPIGLVFNLRHCHLKGEKYIFTKDVLTDKRWWLKNNLGLQEHKSIGLAALKKQVAEQRAKNSIPVFSDLLIGLSKKALCAIAITDYPLISRLQALYAKFEVLKKLKVDLPILFMLPETKLKVYEECDQLRDLVTALKQKKTAGISGDFVEKILKNFSQDVMQGVIDEAALAEDYVSYNSFIRFYRQEHYVDEYDRPQIREEYEYIRCLMTPILHAALGNKFLLPVMLERYPQDKLLALIVLRRAYKMKFEKFYSDHLWGTFEESYAFLLINLNRGDNFILSYVEKRLVEKYLIKQLETLVTCSEISSFWNKYKDSDCLNQRRFPLVDKLFRRKLHVPKSRLRVEEAVGAKLRLSG